MIKSKLLVFLVLLGLFAGCGGGSTGGGTTSTTTTTGGGTTTTQPDTLKLMSSDLTSQPVLYIASSTGYAAYAFSSDGSFLATSFVSNGSLPTPTLVGGWSIAADNKTLTLVNTWNKSTATITLTGKVSGSYLTFTDGSYAYKLCTTLADAQAYYVSFHGGTNGTTNPTTPATGIKITSFDVTPKTINNQQSFSVNWNVSYNKATHTDGYTFELHLNNTNQLISGLSGLTRQFTAVGNNISTPGLTENVSLSCTYNKTYSANFFTCSKPAGGYYTGSTLNLLYDLNKPLYAIGKACVYEGSTQVCDTTTGTVQLNFAP